MQWDSSVNAGFTTGRPWLPLDPEHRTRNVAVLKEDPASILTLYRRLIEFRRRHAALSVGSYRLVENVGSVFAYERRVPGERLLVALNLGHEPHRVALPAGSGPGRVLISTLADRDGEAVTDGLDLRADEGVVLALDGAG